MALADLNRSNDTPIATLKLAEITPKNWHRYPPRVESAAKAYNPVYTWNGGVPGDDQVLAKTNVLVDDRGIGDYTPRNQDDKAIITGNTIVVDVTRPRGAIDPWDPYPKAGDPAEPAPTLASMAPNTAPIATLGQLAIVLTGTNFTQWTKVLFNNIDMPGVTYVSPTKLVLLIEPSKYTAGAKPVFVWDHSVSSAPINFTFT